MGWRQGHYVTHQYRTGRFGQRCIACGIPIFYGERCEKHKRELRQRRRRKPR